jgi:hypothetical protein
MINENINNQILFMIIYINKCITNTVGIADYLSNGKLLWPYILKIINS